MELPDCRVDDTYNEDFLNPVDRDFINGMDYMLNCIVRLLENSLDLYENELNGIESVNLSESHKAIYSTRDDLCKILKENSKILSNIIKDYGELERDILIKSMTDRMSQDDYDRYRELGFELNHTRPFPKTYCDSRKLYCGGK